MHVVLREILHQFVLVYIDDILIYSRSEAKHRQHVAEVLQRLRKNNLFLKAEKCSFHQSSVKFLGYHIDQEGIKMDEGKVTAIQDWPMPTSIKELQRFLGFPNFYRRFIQNYSSIAGPLTDLLKHKPKSLSWTPSATESFNILKETFITAPILVHPDPNKAFVVEVDASTTGVGAVLSPRTRRGQPRARTHPSRGRFYVPSNGPPSPFLLPVSPPPNRRAVHQVYSTFPENNVLPSFTRHIHLWALATPGPMEPSRC